ncbi:hypothetical protein BVW01_02300 [Mycobacterium tuberculosis]|nr:hypothetical protein BVW01_02300 [Mycobacterium tuberculosis]
MPVRAVATGFRATATLTGASITAATAVSATLAKTGVGTGMKVAIIPLRAGAKALSGELSRETLGRNCWRGERRAWIEVRGLRSGGDDELGRVVLNAIQAHPGVGSASLNYPLSRVVVAIDDPDTSLRELCRIVDDAEKAERHRHPDQAADQLAQSPGSLPGDGVLLAVRAVTVAATAAGLTSFDYGSEIGGSTRIPAHYCGLYGHKSTWRSVPLVGHIPSAPGNPGRWGQADMACAGVQVRGARDIIPALEATVGPMRADGGFSYALAPPRAGALKDFRVAVWAEDPHCPIDADVRRAMDDAVAALRAAGAHVVEQPATIPVDMAVSHNIFQSLVFGAFAVDRSTLSPASAAALGLRAVRHPRGEAANALGATLQSHRAWLFADAARHEMRDRWAGFFNEFDVLLLPVTPTPAPLHHNKDHDRLGRTIDVDGVSRSYWDQLKWNALANIAGTPATTMPITTTATGLPIGIQAMGPAGGDRTTVEFAALLTEVLGGFRVPPL